MNISKETENAIATRLGISKPAIPAEVLKHREQTATFLNACNAYNPPRLTEWRSTPADNHGKILEAIKTLEDLAGLYVPTDEITALASKALWENEQEYARQIEAEADRPRREFETAKEQFIAGIDKELRSIAYRSTRLRNTGNWWLENQKTPQAEALTAREDLLNFLRSTVRYMTYKEGVRAVFTEEVILAEALSDSPQMNNRLKEMATVFLALEEVSE